MKMYTYKNGIYLVPDQCILSKTSYIPESSHYLARNLEESTGISFCIMHNIHNTKETRRITYLRLYEYV
jgi:hypothetical protein